MEEREGKREVWKKLFLLRQPEVSFEQEQEIFCNQKKNQQVTCTDVKQDNKMYL